MAFAAAESRRDAIAGVPQQKTYNIGGSYDFGFMKLLGYFDRDTLQSQRENMASISAVVPLGQAEVHVGYDRSKLRNTNGSNTSVDKIKATYQYNLSKRTAMYATVARLDNKDATRLALPGGNGTPTASGKSQGAEFGIRHFF